MRLSAPLLAAAALLLAAVAAGCFGSRTSLDEARENPDAAAGEQRTVLRGTALRERSDMGTDLIAALRAANQNPTTATYEPPKGASTPPHRFNTLLTALEETGLAEVLQGEGPFTLFAPTDDAFRKFSTARLEALFKAENRSQLRRLLRYHLAEGNLVADELAQRSPVTTLQGAKLTVQGEDAEVTVEGARVIQADVGLANGTIHVIDTVLRPPAMR